MVLHYAGSLPPGALVRPDAQAPVTVAPAPPDHPAPVWLAAAPASLRRAGADPARAIAWAAAGGEPVAQAVAANAAGTAIHTAPPALLFEAEQNGGFVLEEAIPDAGHLTLALILRAGPGEARTLAALQPAGGGGSLFLDARGDTIRLAEKGGSAEIALTVPEAASHAVLILAAVEDGHAWLAAGAARSEGAIRADGALTLGLAGAAGLFIGCRGTRSGLRNKLGSFLLTDVLVWPGRNLLARPGDPALTGALALLAERGAHGL